MSLDKGAPGGASAGSHLTLTGLVIVRFNNDIIVLCVVLGMDYNRLWIGILTTCWSLFQRGLGVGEGGW